MASTPAAVAAAATTTTTTSTTTPTRKANEERARRIEEYYIRHDKDRKKTYEHFTDEGITTKTIYHVLRRHELRGDVSFKKPTGRKASVCTPEMFQKVADLFRDNPLLSCREAARTLGIARTTIFRIMAKMREKNLETYKVVESERRCPTCHQKLPQPDGKQATPESQPKKRKRRTRQEIDADNAKRNNPARVPQSC